MHYIALPGGSNKGDNYACELKAIEVLADVKGKEGEQKFNYMAKCFPMNEARVSMLKKVRHEKTSKRQSQITIEKYAIANKSQAVSCNDEHPLIDKHIFISILC